MRSVLLVLLIAVFAACDVRTREEREYDRARRELEQAEEGLAEAREALEEARHEIGESLDEVADELEDEFEDRDLGEAIGRAIEKVGRALHADPDTEPVEFRKLRTLLPDEIDGMERERVEGENAGALGFHVSTVRGRYDGLGRDLDLKIVDLGTLHRLADEGIEALDARLDREWDDGYERTTEIDGYPAHLKVERHGSSTDLEATVLVESRFVVHIEADGRDITEDLVREILDYLVRRLKDLV